MIITPSAEIVESRRGFLGSTSKMVLSAAAVALLAGKDSLAASQSGNSMEDTSILNIALALEHEAINAYQIGAQTGLLKKPALDAAILFQSHHKSHRDALIATIEKMGGSAVQEKKMDAYKMELNVASIKSANDILNLALKLEMGAANAYLSVIPAFKNKDLAKIAGRLAADETMHWTVLASVLGMPLPQSALSFGA
jgi:rubrerythrin